MKLLVTGGAGYIGSIVAKQLLAAGHEVGPSSKSPRLPASMGRVTVRHDAGPSAMRTWSSMWSSEGSMAVLEEGWRSIVRDIGIEFQWEPALELFRAAGQTVEGELVKLDPDFVLEQVAKAPSEFGISARNPARSRRFGGDNMIFCSVQSAPFVSEGDRRGDGSFDDYRRLVRLTHMIDELDSAGYPI